MKFTKVLPKPLAIAWKEYDINKLETYFHYHQKIADNCKAQLLDAKYELECLKRNYHAL